MSILNRYYLIPILPESGEDNLSPYVSIITMKRKILLAFTSHLYLISFFLTPTKKK
jgi:hypothetical protein